MENNLRSKVAWAADTSAEIDARAVSKLEADSFKVAFSSAEQVAVEVEIERANSATLGDAGACPISVSSFAAIEIISAQLAAGACLDTICLPLMIALILSFALVTESAFAAKLFSLLFKPSVLTLQE